MSYQFDAASSEGLLYTTGTIPSTEPITMSGWIRPISGYSNSVISGLADKDASAYYCAHIATGAGPIKGFSSHYGGSGGNNVDTANSASVGAWSHSTIEFTRSGSTNSFTCILDGDTANQATDSNTTANAFSAHDRLTIGQHGDSTPGGYATAYIAEIAMWIATLSADEKAALALGFSPLFIQPQNLVFYAPLWNDTAELLNPGRSVTANGTPVAAPSIHPPMIYPQDARLTVPAAAAAGVTIPRYSINALQHGFSGHPIASLSGGLAA